MKIQITDGGRAEAGYKGEAGDCVTRAIAIATGKPYQEVYDALNHLAKRERTGKRKRTISNARKGVHKQTAKKYLESLGWEWVPTMTIGSGCKVHMRAEELPSGRLVVALSRHKAAVIDGVLWDTYDCTRGGTRCVYGYFRERISEVSVPVIRIDYECPVCKKWFKKIPEECCGIKARK